ncbi:MAG: hypothetical protein JO019_01125 [Candidatus Kaiserbacteria bacterium]|nr:hypothetical protein [Candidatus Kaiserbacteria bacterium]
MRYGPDIVEQILDELRKVPNIRYVCNKVGIDHSTFYRWMDIHLRFHQMVELALYVGRQKMNDAAESVIINGIQNNDFQSAKYFLAHNDERYIGVERVRYFQYLENHRLEFLHRRGDDDPMIEAMFSHFLMLEQTLDPDMAKQEMAILASAFCHQEPNQIKLFKNEYELWKQVRKAKDPEAASS